MSYLVIILEGVFLKELCHLKFTFFFLLVIIICSHCQISQKLSESGKHPERKLLVLFAWQLGTKNSITTPFSFLTFLSVSGHCHLAGSQLRIWEIFLVPHSALYSFTHDMQWPAFSLMFCNCVHIAFCIKGNIFC